MNHMQKTVKPTEIITVTVGIVEAAERLGVNRRTLLRWANAKLPITGVISYFKVATGLTSPFLFVLPAYPEKNISK